MHIKKITLHRFKQFRDAEIELEPGLSLVVGGNNSGKSSILQALATWQFCKIMLEIEKGRSSWLQTKAKTGLGMGIADFTPMQIPSLTHLWTNLKTNKDKEPDGYTLKIGVYWDLLNGQERHLEIGLSQANDRLFVRTTSTNLLAAEIVDAKGGAVDGNVPRVGYLVGPYMDVSRKASFGGVKVQMVCSLTFGLFVLAADQLALMAFADMVPT